MNNRHGVGNEVQLLSLRAGAQTLSFGGRLAIRSTIASRRASQRDDRPADLRQNLTRIPALRTPMASITRKPGRGENPLPPPIDVFGPNGGPF